MSEDSPSEGLSEAQIRATLGSVGRAFFTRFSELREVQRRAIPPIAEGQNVLVCSATASGKTEAVIAPLIWRLRNRAKSVGSRERTTKFLAIAPTRALVSDLLKRLDSVFPTFGWKVGAQSSDHQDARLAPDALITTPESLDSMMVKRFSREQGETTGHLLAGIEAVFVDEAHLFDCSVRGDQVLFLLERLRRLKTTAIKRGWAKSAELQVCGASATVSRADELAMRMLGRGASALVIQGGRELSMLDCQDEWLSVEASTSAPELSGRVEVGASNQGICRKLVCIFREGNVQKVLLFCPSRAMCDGLGEFLARELKRHVDVWLGVHHGSLEGERRRAAETGFGCARGLAVLVATSTLEVGIDIGDVDAVALVGPPPDVPALLQRIGRGGRRSGGTKVIPFAENREHAAAIGGMLVSAASGDFGGGPRFRNWGVLAQQSASYIMQNGRKGRPRRALLDLAEAVWPTNDTRELAGQVIDDLLLLGSLVEIQSRYHLSGPIIERIDEIPTSAHANIRAGASVVPVRNRQTGEIVGHVAGGPTSGFTNIGGQRHKVVAHGKNEIVVTSVPKPKDQDGAPAAVKYPTVPFLITRQYCRELAKGLGLPDDAAPFVDGIWWHFGGQAVEKLLRLEMPQVFVGSALSGAALRVTGDVGFSTELFNSVEEITEVLEKVVLSARSRYSRSSFDDFLSAEVFARAAAEALQPVALLEFLASRRIITLEDSNPVRAKLVDLVA